MATIIREPSVSIALASAVQAVGNTEQRILVIGQKLAAGTAAAGSLVTDIQNNNAWNSVFGEGSILATQIDNVRLYNKVTRVDAIPVSDDVGATAATGVVTVAGAAVAGGSVTVTVGGIKFVVGVANGDTPTIVGAAVAAAITANAKCAVTAANVAGVVTLTAKNGGLLGNGITVVVSYSSSGITASITTQMAGGAVDPVLTTVLDAIGDARYQTIVWPYVGQIDVVKNFLDARWNVANNILDGVAVCVSVDSYANNSALVSGLNSQSVLMIVDEDESTSSYDAGAVAALPWVTGAQVAAIRALRLTEGAAIGSFVIARNGALDRFGGISLASLPYFNTPLPELPVVPTALGWSDSEAESLKADGGSVIGNNISGTGVIFGEMVTTYKTDSASNADVTFKYLNYVDTSSVTREYYYNNLKARFAQSRLTEGALIVGRAMANPELIEAFCVQMYQELAELALVQSGEAAIQFFKENLVVMIDLSTGTATIQMKQPIVTQLRNIIATIEIAFSVEG